MNNNKRHNRSTQHQIIVRHLAVELLIPNSRDANPKRWNVGQSHWALRQRDPIECNQPKDFSEAQGNDDEVSAPDLERDFSNEPSEKACGGYARQKTKPYGL